MEEYNLKVWTPTQGERKVTKYNFETGEATLDIPTVVNVKAKNFKLMRCSGVRDKNGELIYEGHKIKYESYDEKSIKIGQVVFNGGCFFIKTTTEHFYTIAELYKISYRCEIIGNIYEESQKEGELLL